MWAPWDASCRPSSPPGWSRSSAGPTTSCTYTRRIRWGCSLTCCSKAPHSLVVTHHSDIVRQARLRNILQPLFKAVHSRADAIIATSQRYLESSEELGPYRAKVRVVPYGIDLHHFAPSLRDSPIGARAPEEVRRPDRPRDRASHLLQRFRSPSGCNEDGPRPPSSRR